MSLLRLLIIMMISNLFFPDQSQANLLNKIKDQIAKPLCSNLGNTCDELDKFDDNVIREVNNAGEYIKNPKKIIVESVKITMKIQGILREVIIRAGESLEDSLERIKKGLQHLSRESWRQYKAAERKINSYRDKAATYISQKIQIDKDIKRLKESVKKIKISKILDVKWPIIKVELPEIKISKETLIKGLIITAVVAAAIFAPYTIPGIVTKGYIFAVSLTTNAIIGAAVYCNLKIEDNATCKKPFGDAFDPADPQPFDEDFKICADLSESRKRISCYNTLGFNIRKFIREKSFDLIRDSFDAQSSFITSQLKTAGY